MVKKFRIGANAAVVLTRFKLGYEPCTPAALEMNSFLRPDSSLGQTVELSEEDLEVINGGFLNWLVPALLIAYAIKRGANVNVTLPAPTFPPPSGGGGKGDLGAMHHLA